jgi:ABC-type oligopeptide transport system substrate-binding subunit
LGRWHTRGPERPEFTVSDARISRRALLGRLPAVAAGGVLVQIATACSPFTFGPDAVDPEPEETPASIPEPPLTPVPIETPIPAPTPTPAPEPTPTPEPPDQVLRVAGTLFNDETPPIVELPDCLWNGLTTAALVRLSGDLELVPDWAEEWTQLDDRDGWQFRIRENDNGWGNGIPVTAHDFVAQWIRLLDPDYRSGAAPLLFDVESAAAYYRGEADQEDVGLVAVDDWTLEIYLDRQRETFPAVLGSPGLRLRGPDVELDLDGLPCHENGVFRVEQSDESFISLIRNERYWEDRGATLERIELSAMSPAVALTEFQQGTVDLVKLTSTNVTRARHDPALNPALVTGSPFRTVMLVPDIEQPPFDSVEIRRALSNLIDRRRLQQISEGRVVPATRLLPVGLFTAFDDAAMGIATEFDVDAAFREIAESPYPEPREWPSFGLDIPSGGGYLDRVARDVATQLRENLGIQVPIRVHEPAEFADGLRERRYVLAWFDWRYPYADPAAGYAELFAGWRAPRWPVSWSHPEYDELLIAADSLQDEQQRASAFAGCEGLLQEHGAVVPLAHPLPFYLIQSWLTGIPRDGRNRVQLSDIFGAGFVDEITVDDREE